MLRHSLRMVGLFPVCFLLFVTLRVFGFCMKSPPALRASPLPPPPPLTSIQAIAKALTKAKEKDFYLGMDKSWLMV